MSVSPSWKAISASPPNFLCILPQCEQAANVIAVNPNSKCDSHKQHMVA